MSFSLYETVSCLKRSHSESQHLKSCSPAADILPEYALWGFLFKQSWAAAICSSRKREL